MSGQEGLTERACSISATCGRGTKTVLGTDSLLHFTELQLSTAGWEELIMASCVSSIPIMLPSPHSVAPHPLGFRGSVWDPDPRVRGQSKGPWLAFSVWPRLELTSVARDPCRRIGGWRGGNGAGKTPWEEVGREGELVRACPSVLPHLLHLQLPVLQEPPSSMTPDSLL